MHRCDVQFGPSRAFIKDLHIHTLGLGVTQLWIVGYVCEFSSFKMSEKKQKTFIIVCGTGGCWT